jgi:hypothetical protein
MEVRDKNVLREEKQLPYIRTLRLINIRTKQLRKVTLGRSWTKFTQSFLNLKMDSKKNAFDFVLCDADMSVLNQNFQNSLSTTILVNHEKKKVNTHRELVESCQIDKFYKKTSPFELFIDEQSEPKIFTSDFVEDHTTTK